jgi:sortase A
VTRLLRNTTFYSEIVFLLAGTIFLGTAGWRFVSFAVFQRYYELLLHHEGASGNPRVSGKLTVPRLGLSVVVLNGDDASSLNLGAGHMPGTAAIGAPGNTVIAGHRDMAFRALRDVRIGDNIQIQAGKTYAYRVDQIRIVSPEDVSVLRDDGGAKLTMITCYPFNFVGDAPKRYVVQAEMLR